MVSPSHQPAGWEQYLGSAHGSPTASTRAHPSPRDHSARVLHRLHSQVDGTGLSRPVPQPVELATYRFTRLFARLGDRRSRLFTEKNMLASNCDNAGLICSP